MIRRGWLFVLASLLGLAACSGPLLPPTSSPTPPPPSPTATTTIVWFPPTVTPTAYLPPTSIPTPEQRPGVGEPLFTDAFDQPNLWNTATSSSASAVVNQNHLILSLNGQGSSSIFSLRSGPVLGDFYAEATASISLCTSKDQYGMLFRASPGSSYYRFSLNCDGGVRPERVLSGSVQPIQDWLPSGDIPAGAPIEVKLGIWAVGGEFRFFLNDHYQFTVGDPLLHAGTLGFFITASGASPVVAAFSDLSVYSVSYASPTPSPIPSFTPPPSQTP